MNEKTCREKNLILALKYGLITWFQFFEMMRGLK